MSLVGNRIETYIATAQLNQTEGKRAPPTNQKPSKRMMYERLPPNRSVAYPDVFHGFPTMSQPKIQLFQIISEIDLISSAFSVQDA